MYIQHTQSAHWQELIGMTSRRLYYNHTPYREPDVEEKRERSEFNDFYFILKDKQNKKNLKGSKNIHMHECVGRPISSGRDKPHNRPTAMYTTSLQRTSLPAIVGPCSNSLPSFSTGSTSSLVISPSRPSRQSTCMNYSTWMWLCPKRMLCSIA